MRNIDSYLVHTMDTFTWQRLTERLIAATRTRYLVLRDGHDDDGFPYVSATCDVPWYLFLVWYFVRRPRAEHALYDTLTIPIRGKVRARWTWF